MRTLILALIPGLLLGCGDDTTATSLTGESTGSSSTGEPTTGDSDPSSPSDPSNPSDPSAGPTSSPTSATTGPGTVSSASDEVTSDPTLTDPTATTASSDTDGTTTADTTTTDGTSDTTDGTTGGGGLCGEQGPEIEANLVHIGVDPGCGALEFTGQNPEPGVGPVYALDGCPCGANCLKPDPWTLSLDVPMDWLPGILPACPRVVVERQMGKGGCELIGVAIWDAQEPDGAPALYHAGSLLGPIAAAQDELTITQTAVEECDCADCCSTPTRFDLEFGALKSTVTVPEGEAGLLGDQDLGYDIMNFQSHVSGICDDSPDIDWVARRSGKP